MARGEEARTRLGEISSNSSSLVPPSTSSIPQRRSTATLSSSRTTPATPATQLEQLEHATTGFQHLLNNSLPEAKLVLGSSTSPFHLLGAGLTTFLAAALGQEDKELFASLALLSKAEEAATAQSVAKRGKGEPATVFPAGTEYKLLVADSVICQALVHILTESYLEFMKAIFKLNRAYKGFGAVYKIVFPQGVAEDEELASIYAKLNAAYLDRTAAPAEVTSIGSSIFGWGKKRPDLATLRPSASSTVLSALAKVPLEKVAVSTPNSRPDTRETSVEDLTSGFAAAAVADGEVPKAAWEGDAISTLVISGAAFGFGLFGLIFSLLPPKMRKLISWFGFSNSNRTVALKLLTIASAGDDVHGYFASLVLLTYYGVILLMSGWQAEEAYLVQQFKLVLGRVETKFPSGTLWVLNRAKINRMQHDTTKAIEILEGALEKGSSFREADSLLVFELSWCLLSDGQWLKSANSFLRMRELNTWSHATYVFIAAGALLDLPRAERTPEIEDRIEALISELPSLFGNKRLLGEPPSTEMFISRKLGVYRAKHVRWIEQGRLSATSKYWEVIRVSPASELGHFWNTNGRAPAHALQLQIDHLASFSPPPRFGPHVSTLPASPSHTSLSSRYSRHETHDLDTPDEIATRDLLLGALYRSLGAYDVARSFLQSAVDAQPLITDETWVVPFAIFELAVLEPKEAEVLARESEVPKEVWRDRLGKAEGYIARLFMPGEYDLKSRIESRAQMLRDEVLAKRTKLGI